MRIFIFLLLAGCLHAQSTPHTLNPQRLERVDSFLQHLVERDIAPNVQAVVLQGGKEVYRGTFGLADVASGRAARPDDIYRVASQTKAVVTVGLMKLFERGAFFLEDPISKYIPAFAGTQVLGQLDSVSGEYALEPLARPITIRHLLSHTAGIAYEMPGDLDERYPIPFFASLEPVTTEEVVELIAARPLVAQPGEQFVYGLSTDVIGRLVEILSGMPLDAYMQREVFGPLGMQDSYFYLPAEKADRLVSLYSKPGLDDPLVLHENETYRDFAVRGAQTYFSAGAGSVGTIDDYARFCQMLLNGGKLDGVRLLSPTTVAMMLRNQIGELTVWDREDKFGLGLQLITAQSHYGDQATPGSYTWGGMYCSEYTIDPAEQLVLLVYTNVHPTPYYQEVVRKFRVLVYSALE
ncbi:serine hydrolase domain-containing protein [Neolewinella sp.]|uniref:serine hydrolase domain-containing protein n=1 Tax=Neolewinella sp. TaxID=2993543 RepID=UPI003B5275D2